MVGIFSKFYVGRSGHRRTQSAIDEREVLPPNAEAVTAGNVAASHGIDVELEFKPVEHPLEPVDNDQPVQCPLPEPSILNDGRIWKERVSAAGVRRRTDLTVKKEGCVESEGRLRTKSHSQSSNRMILPSLSAPEHNLLNLLDECNSS
ncbi:hypothetical protein V2J09_014769 [Rumex salicifolius]